MTSTSTARVPFYDPRLHEPVHSAGSEPEAPTSDDDRDNLLPRRPSPEPVELLEASKILDDVRRMKLEILELEKGHLRDMKIIRSALTTRGTQTSNSNRSMLENESTVSRWLRDARVHGRTVSDSTVLSTVTALSLTADATSPTSTAPSSPIAPSACQCPASEEDATNVPPVKGEERDEDVQPNDKDHDHDRTVLSSTSNTSPPSPSPAPAPSSSLNPVRTSEERDASALSYDLVCKTASHVPPPSALEEVGDYTLNFMLAESLLNTPALSTACLPPPRRGFRALVARVVRSVRRR